MIKKFAIVMCLTVVFCACGGSDGSLDPALKVNNLNEADLNTLCKELGNLVVSEFGKDNLCKATGVAMIVLGQDQEQCQQMVDLCKSIGFGSECTQIDFEKAGSCNATIEEAKLCTTEATKAAKSAFAPLNCESSKEDVLQVQANLQTPPASCVALEEKCPGFLVDNQ